MQILAISHLLHQTMREHAHYKLNPVVLALQHYRTTVGAIDDTDTFAYFSNYGECVEIQAPVSSIVYTA